MPEDFVADYAYLADLCAACGWTLSLERLDDDRSALRVRERRGGPIIAGAIFATGARLDVVAEVVFESLHVRGIA